MAFLRNLSRSARSCRSVGSPLTNSPWDRRDIELLPGATSARVNPGTPAVGRVQRRPFAVSAACAAYRPRMTSRFHWFACFLLVAACSGKIVTARADASAPTADAEAPPCDSCLNIDDAGHNPINCETDPPSESCDPMADPCPEGKACTQPCCRPDGCLGWICACVGAACAP